MSLCCLFLLTSFFFHEMLFINNKYTYSIDKWHFINSSFFSAKILIINNKNNNNNNINNGFAMVRTNHHFGHLGDCGQLHPTSYYIPQMVFNWSYWSFTFKSFHLRFDQWYSDVTYWFFLLGRLLEGKTRWWTDTFRTSYRSMFWCCFCIHHLRLNMSRHFSGCWTFIRHQISSQILHFHNLQSEMWNHCSCVDHLIDPDRPFLRPQYLHRGTRVRILHPWSCVRRISCSCLCNICLHCSFVVGTTTQK